MSPLFYPVSAGGVSKPTVTATTGSPTIDTSTSPGKTIYKFTGNGSITIGSPGYAELVIVAGGGGGGVSNSGSAGGGAGAGGFYNAFAYLAAGTYSITVGAGGTAAPTKGNNSVFGTITVPGGGRGGFNATYASSTDAAQRIQDQTGGSGGGRGASQGSPGNGLGMVPVGKDGSNTAGGSGGGAGSAGSGTTGGSGITIYGATYAVGGDGGATVSPFTRASGAANTGNGGQGGPSSAFFDGGSGGSGIVLVVI